MRSFTMTFNYFFLVFKFAKREVTVILNISDEVNIVKFLEFSAYSCSEI